MLLVEGRWSSPSIPKPLIDATIDLRIRIRIRIRAELRLRESWKHKQGGL